jgi:hypothetical protein
MQQVTAATPARSSCHVRPPFTPALIGTKPDPT